MWDRFLVEIDRCHSGHLPPTKAGADAAAAAEAAPDAAPEADAAADAPKKVRLRRCVVERVRELNADGGLAAQLRLPVVAGPLAELDEAFALSLLDSLAEEGHAAAGQMRGDDFKLSNFTRGEGARTSPAYQGHGASLRPEPSSDISG